MSYAAQIGENATAYTTFTYQAGTWASEQQVACNAETLSGKLNVRDVVHDRAHESAEVGYFFYCKRGDQENRIKEMKLDLFSGRTSCHRFLANQFRLLLSAAACVLFSMIQ